MYKPEQPPSYGMTGGFATAPPATQIVVPVAFGPTPQVCTCPSCHNQISSRVEKESTAKTHVFALILCLIFCPLVCIPYCTDSCRSSTHYCPSCGAYLGVYDK